jgi:hypothetical protein
MNELMVDHSWMNNDIAFLYDSINTALNEYTLLLQSYQLNSARLLCTQLAVGPDQCTSAFAPAVSIKHGFLVGLPPISTVAVLAS